MEPLKNLTRGGSLALRLRERIDWSPVSDAEFTQQWAGMYAATMLRIAVLPLLAQARTRACLCSHRPQELPDEEIDRQLGLLQDPQPAPTTLKSAARRPPAVAVRAAPRSARVASRLRSETADQE